MSKKRGRMAKHSVTLSDRTWRAVENLADKAGIRASAIIELIVSDRVGDSDYMDNLFEELENDEAAEE